MPYARYFSLTLLSLWMSTAVFSQEVVERSHKKRPAWVGQVEEGFLITTATGATLEEAQRKSLNNVKVQMLESVAQNIEFSSETIVEQITHNQDVHSNIEFRQKGKTSVVNLPFIQGVSLSSASDAYWEQLQDKNTKEQSYMYSLRYPYPKTEFMKLKREFEELDGKMVVLVKQLRNDLPDICSVDTLEANISQLELAEDYFFDSYRKQQTRDVINQYKTVFRQLNIESKRVERCKFRFWITFNGNVMECSYMPKVKSETATKIKCIIDEESYVMTFSDEDCIRDEENQIEVLFRLKYGSLRHKLHF